MKANGEQSLAIGWHAEAFARTKRMKPLGDYFKPELTAEQKRIKGASDVAAMLRRMEKKGKG